MILGVFNNVEIENIEIMLSGGESHYVLHCGRYSICIDSFLGGSFNIERFRLFETSACNPKSYVDEEQ